MTCSSPASARRTAVSRSPGSAVVRNPTRPKLTPKTGTPRPVTCCSARSTEPSPPSTITRSASRDVRLGRSSSTPASAARRATRSAASPRGPARRSAPRGARLRRLRRRHRAAAVAGRPGRRRPRDGRSRRCAGRTRDCRPDRDARSRRRRAPRRPPRVAAAATRSSTAVCTAGSRTTPRCVLGPPGLELRLDERQDAEGVGEDGHQRRQHEREGDERDVDDRERSCGRRGGRRERAGAR